MTVVDTESPAVTCPANVQVSTQAGLCTAPVTFGAFVATDNCGVQASQLASSGLYGNNSVFGLGNRTVSYWAQDGSGNNATCSFAVSVQDHEAPQITCPTNVTVAMDSNVCTAVVNYSLPQYSDNCLGSVLARTAGLAPLGTFGSGASLVSYAVTDGSSNSAVCSFAVTVQDTQAPKITCPSNMVISTDSGVCSRNVTYSTPSASDNCAVQSVQRSGGLASGAIFPLGNTTITYTATDTTGLQSTCSFVVTVVDTTLPVLSGCSSDITEVAYAGLPTFNVTYSMPVVSDNCPSAVVALVSGGASGNPVMVGRHIVTYAGVDGSGNQVTCSWNVTVLDLENPTITCPQNITANAPNTSCAAAVTFSAPSYADNAPGVTLTQTAGSLSGASFPVGAMLESFIATDSSGNTAACSFGVTVVDVTRPVFTSCTVGPVTLYTDAGVCTNTYNYAMPVVSDNCGASLTLVSGLAPGSAFPQVVSTLVSYLAEDQAGLMAYCNFTVTVDDYEAPNIVCPASISVGSTTGYCGANVTFVAPVGTDNCPNATTTLDAGSKAPGSFFVVGTTTESYTVTEGHHPVALTRPCSFTVTVVDVEAPQITCPSLISKTTDAGVCTASVSFVRPVGTDNCVGPVTSGPTSPSTFDLGATSVNFTVVDAVSLSASCLMAVNVTDQEAPKITCPTVAPVATTGSNCNAVVTFADPTVSDNCGVNQLTQVYGGVSGSSFNVGNSTVTYRVTDTSGNTAQCSFVVLVTDGNLPTISCPSSFNVNLSSTVCNASVIYGAPVGQQQCSVTSTAQTAGYVSGAVVGPGTTVQQFTTTDILGRTAMCSFNVSVVDVTAPLVTCPSSIIHNTSAGLCSAVVTYGSATYSDNCGPLVSLGVSSGPSSGSSFGLGSTAITYTARDGSGWQLSQSCSFAAAFSKRRPPRRPQITVECTM